MGIPWVGVQAPRWTWGGLDGGMVAVQVADGARGWDRGPGGTQAGEGYRMVTEHREPRRNEGHEATEMPVTQGRPRAEAQVALESEESRQIHHARGVVGVTAADLAKVAEATREVTQANAG